jgi:hypothetical protein
MNARVSIPSWFLVSFVLLATVVTGCARPTPNAPPSSRANASAMGSFLSAGGSGGYFPLQIGNRWHAESDFRSTLTTPDGGTGTFTIHANIMREIIGTETLAGRAYVVEQTVTDEEDAFGPFNSWIRYRQDAAGLYEADVDISQPPVLDSGRSAGPINAALPEARDLPMRLAERLSADQLDAYQAAWDVLQKRIVAIRSVHALASGNGATHPGGVLADELTRLAYPLRPGATWVIRADPLFGSIVEANGNVVVPAGKFAASQIRITIDGLGPNDVVREWFSRSGQLAFRYHIESVATDVDGNPIGTVSADYDETLRDFSLVRP